MITIRKSDERGKTQIGWLDSRHTFSFGDYRDAGHVSFGPLRVINEDVVSGGSGFPPHSHADMEIVTYVLSGALQHRDLLGTGSVIRPGEVQRMSAGTGISHSEFNASRESPCHFLQIWIVPSKRGIAPSYEQKALDPDSMFNKFSRIAAPEPRETEVRLVQDAEIWAGRFDREEEAIHHLPAGRRAWIQVAKGEAAVCGEALKQGDGAAVTDVDQIRIRTHGGAEILLFDLA